MADHLTVQDLSIQFDTPLGQQHAVKNISFSLKKGETLGIVGESGSGKSVTALAMLQLLSDKVLINGVVQSTSNRNLLTISASELQEIRGKEIAMIFQEPMTSLNPIMSCGAQITEAIQQHQKVSSTVAKEQVLELLRQVQLEEVERIFEAYPHQLSGGQKQRIMIAMALSARPSILIADEPTTALDVTVQKDILSLLNQLKAQYQFSIIFISHDLGVIKQMADRVLVMRAGHIVEKGTVAEIFNNPQHIYTKGLLACRPAQHFDLSKLPTLDTIENEQIIPLKDTVARKQQLAQQPILLKVDNLSTWYPAKKNFFGKTTAYVKAVNQVSFEIIKGETFGLVGSSGCGKSTLGRTILGLERSQAGSVWYQEKDLMTLSETEWRTWRKRLQIIFQDPYSSLNPVQPIGDAIMEPMKVHGLWRNDLARKDKAIDLLETVGLKADHFLRFPHEFSGGQRQRICIARALALEPEFIICDECVSALDVSVQAQIINLLIDLRTKFDLTYIFISHDLSVVRFISDRIMVMRSGKVVEIGDATQIYDKPKSIYTRELIDAIPV